MDISLALSVVSLVAGLVLYLISTGKVQDVGRIMFAAGLLATLLRFGGHVALHT